MAWGVKKKCIYTCGNQKYPMILNILYLKKLNIYFVYIYTVHGVAYKIKKDTYKKLKEFNLISNVIK